MRISFIIFLLSTVNLHGQTPKFPGNPDRNLVVSIDYQFDYFGYGKSEIRDSYGFILLQESEPKAMDLSIQMTMPVSNRLSLLLGGSFYHSHISWDPSPIVRKDKTSWDSCSLSAGLKIYLKNYYR
ncbi:MAG: hypothetical protein JSW64_03845 [Candidatus Zixiibacteriota bacterium]|nr:MAG: hypothetical protein JSW64_03845 [candidate division Zixibacteria bacterium]